MNLWLSFGFLLVCANVAMSLSAETSNESGTTRRLNILSEKADVRETGDGKFQFPDVIEFTIDILGKGIKNIVARKLKIANRNARKGPRSGGKKSSNQEVEYYTDKDGSYACKPSRRNGSPSCELIGIIHDEKQSCFFKGDKAMCADKSKGIRKTLEVPEEEQDDIEDDSPNVGPRIPYPGNRKLSERREKRQIEYPDENVRVVRLAFCLDKAFMKRFYDLNPGRPTDAREDAEMYVTMISNEVSKGVPYCDLYCEPNYAAVFGETYAYPYTLQSWKATMTYRYQSIKDLNLTYRGATLDLAVNPVQIIYPRSRWFDLPFVVKFRGFVYEEPTMTLFRGYVRRRLDADSFDHALLITGLGAQHDSFGNECPDETYLMSARLVQPNDTTKDTLETFSQCSGEYFVNHLSSVADCLSIGTHSNFRENFCEGPRGHGAASLDVQCQIYYGRFAIECNGNLSVPATGCYEFRPISCYLGDEDICLTLPYVADGTPCIPTSPEGGKSYYCYLGNCVEEDEICPASEFGT